MGAQLGSGSAVRADRVGHRLLSARCCVKLGGERAGRDGLSQGRRAETRRFAVAQ